MWTLRCRSSAYWEEIRQVHRELLHKRDWSGPEEMVQGDREEGCLVESPVGFEGGRAVERGAQPPRERR